MNNRFLNSNNLYKNVENNYKPKCGENDIIITMSEDNYNIQLKKLMKKNRELQEINKDLLVQLKNEQKEKKKLEKQLLQFKNNE